MDYGPDKLDADILLNYGATDEFVSRVGLCCILPLTNSQAILELPTAFTYNEVVVWTMLYFFTPFQTDLSYAQQTI